jgi:hypothetical protein
VVLERLAFHLRNGFDFILGIVRFVHQLADFVFHEAGQLDVEIRVSVGDGLEHPAQIILVEFGEFRESVVGQQVSEFLSVGGVVLFIHGDRVTADQKRGFQPSVAAHDQARALRHGNRVAPALLLDDRRQQLELVGAVAVRIDRIRLEGVRIDEAGVGAMHGDAHAPAMPSTSLRLTRQPRRMEALSPDIAKKLLNRDFANLVARVQKGGKLTRAERAMLQSLATGTGAAPATAASYVELAAVLGISRQSINAWKKRKDAPKPAANGLHDVAAWREFMRRNDLKGSEPATQDAADLETSLKARKLLAEVEERELRLGIKRGDFVAVEEVRQTWTEFVAQATAMLRKKFEQELPPILSGLDATGIQEEARRAIDEVLTILHQGE